LCVEWAWVVGGGGVVLCCVLVRVCSRRLVELGELFCLCVLV